MTTRTSRILLIALAASASCADPAPDAEPATTTVAADRCLRSPHSVLLGPPTGSGENQGQGPGWLRLHALDGADSGRVELVDGSRAGLDGTWRRSGDSIRISAFDDFLRVEHALRVTDAGASGRATAHSDAALERDSAGQTRELRREWALEATPASCDSMPSRGGSATP